MFDPVTAAFLRGFSLVLIFITYRLAPKERKAEFLRWFEKWLLPDPEKGKRSYSRFANIIIYTSCLLLIVLSLPPVMSLLDSYVIATETQAWLATNKGEFKIWANWASTALEIAIVLFLGGAVFGARATDAFKKVLDEYETQRLDYLEKRKTELSERIQELDAKITASLSGSTGGSGLSRFLQFYKSANSLQATLLSAVPKFQRRLISARFLVSFPGGSYGLIAFVLFLILTSFKIAGLYVDGSWIA